MKRILHITNGSSAIEVMKEAGIVGDFLSWDDVLHVGPVPGNLSFENLSEIRAEYIINKGWAGAEAVDRTFRERFVLMDHIEKYEKVILCFEHDLYDQLQLLEILSYLSHVSFDLLKLSMICTENYLGRQSAEEMAALKQYEAPVTVAQMELAVDAWKAFRCATPFEWSALLNEDTSALPFLQGTVLRMLEEYPSSYNGLSRTQNDILDIVAQGEKSVGKIFAAQQEREERIFLGDTVFADIVNEMMSEDASLLTSQWGDRINPPFIPVKKVQITAYGLEVLSGEQQWLEKCQINKWLGGVHLTAQNVWLWNSETQKIERG